MALKLLTKLAAKSKIAKAGILASKTKTGVLASTAVAKLGTTAIATTSTAKAGLIVSAAVATSVAVTTTTLGTETLGDGVLARTTAASIKILGDNIIPLTLTVAAFFVLLIVVQAIQTIKREAKILQDYKTKVLQDYHEATNTIASQETLGISHEKKTELIKIIHLFLIEFMNKIVFDTQRTAHFLGYIQRDCINFPQAFLLVDRFMAESQQSVPQSILNLKTLMKKLDAAEKSCEKGTLSYVDFRQKVENIILGLDDEKFFSPENLKLAAKVVTKIALFSIGGLDLF